MLLTESGNDDYNLRKTFYAAIAYHKNVLYVNRVGGNLFFVGKQLIWGFPPNTIGWIYVLQANNDPRCRQARPSFG
jgi:hypothetical protein